MKPVPKRLSTSARPAARGSCNSRQDPKGGFNTRGGVNFGSRTKFFIETRYHRTLTTNAPTQVILLSFGIRW